MIILMTTPGTTRGRTCIDRAWRDQCSARRSGVGSVSDDRTHPAARIFAGLPAYAWCSQVGHSQLAPQEHLAHVSEQFAQLQVVHSS